MKIGGRVERVSRLSVDTFRDRYLSRSPVIITDMMASWKAMDWNVQLLKDRFGNSKIPLRMSDDEFEAFCEAADDRFLRDSKEARRLGTKELSFWIIKLEAYFDSVLRGGSLTERLPCIMDVPLSRSIIESYLQVLGIDTLENWGPLTSGLETLIADVSFPDYLAGNRDYRFWFTPRPRARGVIHADGYHNLNAQIRGRKEWILLPPEQWGRLQGRDIKPQMDNPVQQAEMPKRREHGEAEGFSCATDEGDILYIPKSWWHAATALRACINVNAWHLIPT